MTKTTKFSLAGVVLALAAGVAVYCAHFQTYHFAVVQEGVLYRDGFQGMRRFENAYRRYPFKSVINIQADSEVSGKYAQQVAQEQAFCKQHGLNYFAIPMKTETPPDAAQTAAFLKIVDDPANRPVFVHDSQGVIREGMMVAVWQMERMNYTPARALAEIKRFGHPPSKVLEDFINSHGK